MQKNKENISEGNKWKQGLRPTPLFKELIRLLAKSVAKRLKEMQDVQQK